MSEFGREDRRRLRDTATRGEVYTTGLFLPSNGGYYNLAVYPPGHQVEALGGDLTFGTWSIVWWFPGKPTILVSASSIDWVETLICGTVAGEGYSLVYKAGRQTVRNTRFRILGS